MRQHEWASVLVLPKHSWLLIFREPSFFTRPLLERHTAYFYLSVISGEIFSQIARILPCLRVEMDYSKAPKLLNNPTTGRPATSFINSLLISCTEYFRAASSIFPNPVFQIHPE